MSIGEQQRRLKNLSMISELGLGMIQMVIGDGGVMARCGVAREHGVVLECTYFTRLGCPIADHCASVLVATISTLAFVNDQTFTIECQVGNDVAAFRMMVTDSPRLLRRL